MLRFRPLPISPNISERLSLQGAPCTAGRTPAQGAVQSSPGAHLPPSPDSTWPGGMVPATVSLCRPGDKLPGQARAMGTARQGQGDADGFTACCPHRCRPLPTPWASWGQTKCLEPLQPTCPSLTTRANPHPQGAAPGSEGPRRHSRPPLEQGCTPGARWPTPTPRRNELKKAERPAPPPGQAEQGQLQGELASS